MMGIPSNDRIEIAMSNKKKNNTIKKYSVNYNEISKILVKMLEHKIKTRIGF